MEDWKTMFEVAKSLGISKNLVRYHRSKLSDEDVKKKNGVTYISPNGVEEIRSFLRKTDLDISFEESVLEKLESIQTMLKNSYQDSEKNPRQVIKDCLDYLKNEEGILEVLSELEQESRGTKENKIYPVLIDYLEDDVNLMDDFFG
ncbi:hypothetical protein ACXM1Q_005500 [Streptococcus sp. 10F2]